MTKRFEQALIKLGNYTLHHDAVIDASWCAKVIEEARQEYEALRQERDALKRELDHEASAHLVTIDDRDSAEDALQKAHIALGGDGEWVTKFAAAHELPGCTGDLRLDVPHICAQIFEEAKYEQERAEAAERKLTEATKELRDALRDAQAAVCFFASVIKSGEPWTEQCETALQQVRKAEAVLAKYPEESES